MIRPAYRARRRAADTLRRLANRIDSRKTNLVIHVANVPEGLAIQRALRNRNPLDGVVR